ncbi:AAA family ATPase [Amycolatopsis rhizosphaerae]|uniref:AAA family ATPase n=1 Tax=Amycolatopsis rhizosphaerae TaxID=2053003 RepID=A0A558D9X8_9PSEU|nr:AAA family ATPase [Amycolatopsis rhizosphaerae]TVT57827.1 AAA family ATPase [Amycolatopsis rhizosphaerae]
MLDAIDAAAGPLISVTGAAGVGRTTLLAQLSERLAERGVAVWAMRFTRDGEAIPARFTLRPGSSPDGVAEPVTQLPGGDASPWAWSPIRPADGARDDPAIARRAAAAAAAPLLRAGRETVLLIDDVHWIDPDSLAVLAALIRQLAGTPVRCVCTARVPAARMAPELGAAVRELRRAGLATAVRLAPLTRGELTRQVTAVLQATPEPALVTRVHELSRGVAAAVRDSIDMVRHNGSVEVVDRQAYLVQRTSPGDPPAHNQLVQAIRALGQAEWAAAKAVAVLCPLGAAVPRLVGEALGVPEPEAVALLDSLCQAGVLHRGLAGRSWRFTVPLVASAVTACLGPFERRRLAATVVTAVWAGSATCGDTDYLADQVANAGALVDRQRALGELLNRSAAVQQDKAESAVRWLGAAIELAENRAQRAMVLLMHTSTCHLHGDYERSLRGAQSLLGAYADQLSPDAAQEVQLMAVQGLHCVGDEEALRELVELRRRWAGGIEHSVVTRAFALAALDRWTDVHELLNGSRAAWRAGNPTSAMLGELLGTTAELWSGRCARFEQSLLARERWTLRATARHRLDQVGSHVTGLLVTGDLSRAEKLLIDEDLPVTALPRYDQAMVAALRGDAALALDLTRRAMATTGRGYDPGYAGMLQTTIWILVLQGRLTTARALLKTARAAKPVLAHLLDAAEARLDRALGETGQAVSRLRRALADAQERGLLVGADVCRAELVDLALDAGDHEAARSDLDALTQVTATMPTSRSTMYLLLARATVKRDRAAAAECLRQARERGQPLELAVVLERLVKYGVAEPELLNEAYELLGGLDALLARAWLRNLMRDHGVSVRGRKETVAENEHLLAMLAAGGLTNKQLAMALCTSDKSIEGRLSRLFTRTGYRSRIELSTAMLNGEYRP